MAHLLIKDTVISDRRLPLPGKVVVFGRSLDADVPVPHKSVSRRHALLEEGDGAWLLSDLGSVNGCQVGERKLEPGERVPVALGGAFRIGHVDFILAPDEVLGESEPVHTAGALSLAAASPPSPHPVALAPATAAAPVTTEGSRLSPAIAKRAAQRKQRRDAMRWVGVLVTFVLLTFAVFFVYRIVERERAKKPAEVAPAEPEAREEEYEIRPLTTSGD